MQADACGCLRIAKAAPLLPYVGAFREETQAPEHRVYRPAKGLRKLLPLLSVPSEGSQIPMEGRATRVGVPQGLCVIDSICHSLCYKHRDLWVNAKPEIRRQILDAITSPVREFCSVDTNPLVEVHPKGRYAEEVQRLTFGAYDEPGGFFSTQSGGVLMHRSHFNISSTITGVQSYRLPKYTYPWDSENQLSSLPSDSSLSWSWSYTEVCVTPPGVSIS